MLNLRLYIFMSNYHSITLYMSWKVSNIRMDLSITQCTALHMHYAYHYRLTIHTVIPTWYILHESLTVQSVPVRHKLETKIIISSEQEYSIKIIPVSSTTDIHTHTHVLAIMKT